MSRIGFVLLVCLAGCSDNKPAPAPAPAHGSAVTRTTHKATVARKDPATAKTLIQKGAVVIDVRNPEEYAEGHLPNAVNIPMTEIGKRLAEVDALIGGDKNRPIVLYCSAGARSAKAQATLVEAGYTLVFNGGGLDDLQ